MGEEMDSFEFTVSGSGKFSFECSNYKQLQVDFLHHQKIALATRVDDNGTIVVRSPKSTPPGIEQRRLVAQKLEQKKKQQESFPESETFLINCKRNNSSLFKAAPTSFSTRNLVDPQKLVGAACKPNCGTESSVTLSVMAMYGTSVVLRNVDCNTKVSSVKEVLIKKLGSEVNDCRLWRANDEHGHSDHDTALDEDATLAEAGIMQNTILSMERL